MQVEGGKAWEDVYGAGDKEMRARYERGRLKRGGEAMGIFFRWEGYTLECREGCV